MQKLFFILTGIILLFGCATVPTDPEAYEAYKEANDPLEPLNRKISAFNDVAEKYVMRPIGEGYRSVTTPVARSSFRNFVINIKTPLYIINDTLQLNLKDALKNISRFTINSTIGFFGFFDVAQRLGIETDANDFGKTLAVWGVPEGPYLVVPFMGPSNFRDVLGQGSDYFINPPLYRLFASSKSDIGIALSYERSYFAPLVMYEKNMNLIDDVRSSSLDPYINIRTYSRQLRRKSVNKAKGVSNIENKKSYDFDMDDEEDE
ncbi:MAG: VacJ family lipoprotein [Alphaproteobacteria bacterium]|nr:VacJ family lipoprotein [Alphaproteobacteria bacterium]